MTAIAEEIPRLDPARQARARRTATSTTSRRQAHPRRPPRRREPRHRRVRRDRPGDEARDRRGRGPALLRPPRRRRPRRSRAPSGPTSATVGRAGRLDDHAAVREERLRQEPAVDRRKLREAALAWQLEQQWSKDRILTEYLNTIYFGNGAYGVEQAARVYFGRSADAGSTLPPRRRCSPASRATRRRYDPVTNPRAARERRDARAPDDARPGRDLPRRAVPRRDRRAAARSPTRSACPARSPATRRPYFANYVKQQLVDKYGAQEVFGGGLRVQTTIDLELQELARKAIAKWLTDVGPDGGARRRRRRAPAACWRWSAARNFRESQFNLAVQGERQPGSSFKPFVLAAALREGISTVDHVRVAARSTI